MSSQVLLVLFVLLMLGPHFVNPWDSGSQPFGHTKITYIGFKVSSLFLATHTPKYEAVILRRA